MNYESLIFDIDGTLWDVRQVVADGYNRQLEQEGLDLTITAEMFRPLFGRINNDIADVIFATVPQAERYELMDRCMRAGDQAVKQYAHIGYPGLRQTLETLAKNHRLFIVSNSQVGYPQTTLHNLGLEDLFTDTLCHGQTGVCKGESIRILMERNAITSCAYIGDTQMDYEATRLAEVPFVWAAYGFGQPEGWDAKAETFADLVKIFQG